MKHYYKYLLTILFMSFFLLAGLQVGKNTAFAVNESDPDPNGWVCPPDDELHEPGTCLPNYNVTECTWGPSGCDDGPVPKN